MKSMPINITDQTIANEVQEGLTLVDFWAPWCGPCHMIAPILEELDEELGSDIKIAKLNIDENPVAANHFNIRSIPSMILFKDGEALELIVGVQPKEVLKNYLEEKINEK